MAGIAAAIALIAFTLGNMVNVAFGGTCDEVDKAPFSHTASC